MAGKDIINHFTNFVYVFSVKKEKEFLSWLLKGELGWRLRLYNSRKSRDKQLVGYYLPYMRKILYPSSLWDRTGFRNFFNGGNAQRVNTLYALACKDFANKEFEGTKVAISFDAGSRFIEGEVYEISLRMFKRGVVFLVFKTRLVGDSIGVDDLLDFNCCCRVLDDEINLPHFPNVKIYTQRRGAFGKMQSFIEFLTGGFTSGYGEDLPGGRMLVYSYCCLSQDMWQQSSDHIFQKYKYVWRNDMNQLVEGKVYREESDYAPWKYSRYGFTVESGVALCCDKDVFNLDILPFYFGGNFFDLYLFSLYQRIRLMRFSQHLANTEIFRSSKKKVAELREDILNFFNQYIFNQVSNYSIGNEIWRKWQDVLEIESMFLQVHQELADMDEYLKSIRQESMDRSLAYATFLLIPVSVISGVLGSNITELQGLSIKNPWIWGTTLSLYVVLLISYARALLRRNKRERGDGNI
ncbi:MAG: hypothetical protein HPY66_0695 [Firmicutes bacterium]|nr:hypothetical protein [Bacillota bacterium]MDI6706966.1 hypothetical protein [Bacillota bacterium]